MLMSVQELDRAKRMIADLEAELQTERSRLRTLTTEQKRVQRQKDDVLTQLQRTESVSFLKCCFVNLLIQRPIGHGERQEASSEIQKGESRAGVGA